MEAPLNSLLALLFFNQQISALCIIFTLRGSLWQLGNDAGQHSFEPAGTQNSHSIVLENCSVSDLRAVHCLLAWKKVFLQTLPMH